MSSPSHITWLLEENYDQKNPTKAKKKISKQTHMDDFKFN